MIRTVISLDSDDKQWLDRKAKEKQVTMTELVRAAVRHYRHLEENGIPSLDDLLTNTSGLWKAGDGLTYQCNARDEWEPRG